MHGVAASASPVVAPGSPASDPPSNRLRPHIMAMGGVSGLTGDGLHPFGGLELGLRRGRWGGVALGQYGYGNDFESVLVAAGPLVKVATVDRIDIFVHGGAAYYSERLDAGFDRDVIGGYGALSLRVKLPVGALGATLSIWTGRLDGQGVTQPAMVTGHRVSVGIGL